MATKRLRQLVESDLASARKEGKTYNQFYADTRESQYKQGMLSKDAYKRGEAYELIPPKKVRKIIDTYPTINSKKQYDAERSAGDPHALRLSFEEWKKL
jgi:hypothetical protein